MLPRWTARVVVALCLVTFPAVVPAQTKVADPDQPAVPVVAATCNTAAFDWFGESFGSPVSIPDNVSDGVTFGPVASYNDGSPILDVILEVDMDHTWVGDLVIVLRYDENCDGTVEDSTYALCRPGRGQCWGSGNNGYNKDVLCAAPMTYSDAALAGLGGASTPISTGCYKPTGKNSGPMSAFANDPSGGCWSMNVSDHADLDLGTVCSWAVWVRTTQSTPVVASTWGRVKQIYR